MFDDRQLIQIIRSGKIDAFNEIVERYQSPIGRYLFRLTADYQTAQDLAQETFIKAYHGLLKSEADISLKPWLYRIATNTAISYLRPKNLKVFVPLDEAILPDSLIQESQAAEYEDRAIVEETFAAIPAERRTPMVLHFLEGLKYAEIGTVLGISEDAARKRVERGSLEFKKLFGDRRGGV